jgi:hypothetical protein
MKRSVFLALLLTAPMLLILAFVLVGCEDSHGTRVIGTSVAEGPMPNPESPSVPGETPAEGTSTTDAPAEGTLTSNPVATAAASQAPAPAVTRYEETDSHLVWTGEWLPYEWDGWSGGHCLYTEDPGASVTVKFSGTSISFISAFDMDAGIAKVTLDGGNPIMVDCYADDIQITGTVWESGNLAWGSHIVKIEYTSTANPNVGTWPIMYVDAFDVTGTLQ